MHPAVNAPWSGAIAALAPIFSGPSAVLNRRIMIMAVAASSRSLISALLALACRPEALSGHQAGCED